MLAGTLNVPPHEITTVHRCVAEPRGSWYRNRSRPYRLRGPATAHRIEICVLGDGPHCGAGFQPARPDLRERLPEFLRCTVD